MKFFIILLSIVCFSQSSFAGKIYKYTDANGNIYYSEHSPFTDSKEAEIKGVKTIESNKIESKSSWKKSNHKNNKRLNHFEDFAILNPIEDQIITSVDKNITVGVNLTGRLSTTYRIKFFIDDIPHGKVKSYNQLIADMEFGEHTVYAQVIEARSRKVIETTATVKFYVK